MLSLFRVPVRIIRVRVASPSLCHSAVSIWVCSFRMSKSGKQLKQWSRFQRIICTHTHTNFCLVCVHTHTGWAAYNACRNIQPTARRRSDTVKFAIYYACIVLFCCRHCGHVWLVRLSCALLNIIGHISYRHMRVFSVRCDSTTNIYQWNANRYHNRY